MAMASSEMTLKLLVDKKANKVLFAEAGKDLVDFVFGILTLPVSKVEALVSAGTMHMQTTVGSAGRLYKSVADMEARYLPSADKRDLLAPKLLRGADDRQLLTRFNKMYVCPSGCMTAVAVEATAGCPLCKKAMAKELALVLPSAAQNDGASGGYVNGLVTYMVTDGLVVTPLTSGITLINRFSADKDVELVEKIVSVGTDERSALIQAALRSDTVLSDVFLARKNQEPTSRCMPSRDNDALAEFA